MRKIIAISMFFVAFFLVVSRPAYAYLDPGTGSVILQALAAGVLAVGIGWRWILNFLKGIFKKG